MEKIDKSDETTFAPFILMDDTHRSLFMSDRHMEEKAHIFEEQGWVGNGYDWGSLAQVVVDEQLPDLQEELRFHPEAGMFSATGSREALEQLGKAMAALYHDDNAIRDVLSRAEVD